MLFLFKEICALMVSLKEHIDGNPIPVKNSK
jgi:hypothetical protein